MPPNYNPNNTIAVIGAGPAGMSAAIYAKRSAVDVLLFERVMAGGQIMTTQWIENYLGFPAGTTPSELVAKFQEHIASLGIDVTSENIKRVIPGDLQTVETESGKKYKCKAVVVATGARPRFLGVPGEWQLHGKGVTTCAVCDGNFFRNQTVAVVGGGTTAVEDVIYLSKIVKKIYHIHRRDQLRLAGETSDELAKLKNVERVFNHTVEEILGEKEVTGIRVKNREDGSVRDIELSGVFVAVGIAPNSDFVKDLLETDEGGFIVTKKDMSTSVEGVFAAGDVRVTDLRQVCTAVADGALAGLGATKRITGIDLA
ncbi:MAG: thioredoxin-disulfide reductase [Candidatus Coatesbacteria bacterium]|nr:thioredoxin-disulfide reductase [Candidatus Coatesbacteria bacterium]